MLDQKGSDMTQTITRHTKVKNVELSAKWKDTSDKAQEIEMLSLEIEEMLDKLGPKYKELVRLMTEAYVSAPLTDCSLGVSPMGTGKMMVALKNHLRKRGLPVDTTFIGDANKLPDFSSHIQYATKWLLKLSNLGGVSE
jgi:hypothetical protein